MAHIVRVEWWREAQAGRAAGQCLHDAAPRMCKGLDKFGELLRPLGVGVGIG